MSNRNRSQGWRHAKLSGHKNEVIITRELLNNKLSLKSAIGLDNIQDATTDGINEQNVPSVLGDSTKSKTDIKIVLNNNQGTKNISIKKSAGGQIYLIRTSRFIKGYEAHFGNIPKPVQLGLQLFFGEHDDVRTILSKQKGISDKINKYQKRKNRLVWTSLMDHSPETAEAMLSWFKSNIGNIAEFCFSRGLAKNKSEWANFIWYKNRVDSETFDYSFTVKEIVNYSSRHSENIAPGNSLGGTTLQLPFGHLQWHLGQMQFHHSLTKLQNIRS